jgi:hypothetical protein
MTSRRTAALRYPGGGQIDADFAHCRDERPDALACQAAFQPNVRKQHGRHYPARRVRLKADTT